MTFAGAAVDYDRFMGRYSASLAVALTDFAGILSGQQVLDVGCGPGALTATLVTRVGADRVAAIDPAPQFAEACRQRYPGVDVRVGPAEVLPWATGTFDAALACLVIAFMADPDRGLAEMARVTSPGGRVAACMWDTAEGMTMMKLYWAAVQAAGSPARGEDGRPGTREGDIARRLTALGLVDVVDGALEVQASYEGFDDLWDSLSLGVGPVGLHLQAQSESARAGIRDHLRAALGDGAFTLSAKAWVAAGTVPGLGAR